MPQVYKQQPEEEETLTMSETIPLTDYAAAFVSKLRLRQPQPQPQPQAAATSKLSVSVSHILPSHPLPSLRTSSSMAPVPLSGLTVGAAS